MKNKSKTQHAKPHIKIDCKLQEQTESHPFIINLPILTSDDMFLSPKIVPI